MTAVEILALPLRTTFVSPKSGITLTAVSGSFGHVDVDDVLAGRATRIELGASQDGRSFYHGVWHTDADGPETDGVWAEIWTTDGCRFHGVIDSVSRKIVQVG